MAKDFIKTALEKQAEHLTGETPLAIVENWKTALEANILFPEILWVNALPSDSLRFAIGLPKVVIFPSSEKTFSLWRKRNIGKVLDSFLPDAQSVLERFLREEEEEEKKTKIFLNNETNKLTKWKNF